MVLRDLIKVEREVQTGLSATNTPIKSWITVITNLKSDIQADTSKINFVSAGQTVTTDKVLFCHIADIREKDKITDLKTGTKYKAMNVNPYSLLGHLEVSMKAGVY
jgi:hypothetical protein